VNLTDLSRANELKKKGERITAFGKPATEMNRDELLIVLGLACESVAFKDELFTGMRGMIKAFGTAEKSGHDESDNTVAA